jgi:hypothetical protein
MPYNYDQTKSSLMQRRLWSVTAIIICALRRFSKYFSSQNTSRPTSEPSGEYKWVLVFQLRSEASTAASSVLPIYSGEMDLKYRLDPLPALEYQHGCCSRVVARISSIGINRTGRRIRRRVNVICVLLSIKSLSLVIVGLCRLLHAWH